MIGRTLRNPANPTTFNIDVIIEPQRPISYRLIDQEITKLIAERTSFVSESTRKYERLEQAIKLYGGPASCGVTIGDEIVVDGSHDATVMAMQTCSQGALLSVSVNYTGKGYVGIGCVVTTS